MAKNIISFSLWGDDPMYWNGAYENLRLARIYYPDYVCRFYVDNEADNSLVRPLIDNGAEIVSVVKRSTHDGEFWRFDAFSDPEASWVIVRDCDSRISERERLAHEDWMKSGRAAHIMRDHPYHQHAILAGMFGCRASLLCNMSDLVAEWPTKNRKGCDQAFLTQKIYPFLRFEAMEHSEFGLTFGAEIRPFPSPRDPDGSFVGEVFDAENTPNREHRMVIKNYLSAQAKLGIV